jgi:hypothetical protein
MAHLPPPCRPHHHPVSAENSNWIADQDFLGEGHQKPDQGPELALGIDGRPSSCGCRICHPDALNRTFAKWS